MANVSSFVLLSVTIVPYVLSGISEGIKSPPWGADIIIGREPGWNSMYLFLPK